MLTNKKYLMQEKNVPEKWFQPPQVKLLLLIHWICQLQACCLVKQIISCFCSILFNVINFLLIAAFRSLSIKTTHQPFQPLTYTVILTLNWTYFTIIWQCSFIDIVMIHPWSCAVEHESGEGKLLVTLPHLVLFYVWLDYIKQCWLKTVPYIDSILNSVDESSHSFLGFLTYRILFIVCSYL